MAFWAKIKKSVLGDKMKDHMDVVRDVHDAWITDLAVQRKPEDAYVTTIQAQAAFKQLNRANLERGQEIAEESYKKKSKLFEDIGYYIVFYSAWQYFIPLAVAVATHLNGGITTTAVEVGAYCAGAIATGITATVSSIAVKRAVERKLADKGIQEKSIQKSMQPLKAMLRDYNRKMKGQRTGLEAIYGRSIADAREGILAQQATAPNANINVPKLTAHLNRLALRVEKEQAEAFVQDVQQIFEGTEAAIKAKPLKLQSPKGRH